jgi:hypothetical protein
MNMPIRNHLKHDRNSDLRLTIRRNKYFPK